MKFFKTSFKFSTIASLGIILAVNEASATPQASLQRRGIITDPTTAAKMFQTPSLLQEYQQHAKAAGMTAEEYVKEKEAHPNETAANIVANHQLGGALAHAGVAVDDKNKKAAKHLQALHQPLTAQSIAATVHLQEALHIANPTLDEIKAEEYIEATLHLQAPDHNHLLSLVYLQTNPGHHLAAAIAAPTLDQINAAAHLLPLKNDFNSAQLSATEYLLDHTSAGHIAAPTLAQVDAVVHLQENTGNHLTAAIPQPTLLQIKAAAHLLTLKNDFNSAKLQATLYLQTSNKAGLPIAAPTLPQIDAVVHLQENRGNHMAAAIDEPTLILIEAAYYLSQKGINFNGRQLRATALLQTSQDPNFAHGSPPLDAPEIAEIDAVASVISLAEPKILTEFLWAVRNGFAGLPAGTVPNGIALVKNSQIRGGEPTHNFEIVWVKPGHGFAATAGRLFGGGKEFAVHDNNLTPAHNIHKLKEDKHYVIFMDLRDDINPDLVTFEHGAQHP
jgi:hypothetical protein